MNKEFENLLYQSGLTAQGCWDQMDDYDRAAIEKFAELIVRECMDNLAWHGHDEAVSQLNWFLHHEIRGEK